ncbi:MAG: hypothetical protein A2W93_12540 [Bacteroidetes bacterium GWF2_43_63]|nr:MAG: hypothetical protein A2W94_14660 [Bacteroidetes bacterium GWE2_42_42]OFY54190.1 MAG: hypothetical protein A2W93_12540 [Bacteroidetes bacterium GWF2_43_63]
MHHISVSNKLNKTITTLILLLSFHFSLFTFYSLTAQVRPDQIPGLQLWLRADSNVVLSGDTVVSWNDCSGNANNAVQPIASKRPKFINNIAELNNLPVVRFDGIDDYFTGNLSVSSNDITFIAIFKINSYIQYSGILSMYDNLQAADWNNTNSIVGFFIRDNQIYSARESYDLLLTNVFPTYLCASISLINSSWSSFKNGEFVSLENIFNANFNINKYVLGSRYSSGFNYFSGIDLAELTIYSTEISSANVTAVETYLMNKYAPPISLGPDTNITYGFCSAKISAKSGYTSYLWSTGSTADSIVVNQTGDYWVEVVDIFGRTSRDTIHVQYPYTALPDSGICLTDTITMNTGLDHAYSFLWIDGSTDSLLNIWEPGEYWVEITDSTAAHCSVRDTFFVVADSFAVQASLGPDLSLCGGNEIALVSGIEPGIEYVWSTGDTTALIPVYTTGDYMLTATNSNGCVAKDTVAVNIIGVKPTVAFTSSTSCLGDASAFTDLSYAAPPDGVAAWSWDFGGQGTSVQQNPQFEFGAAGDYNVELVVTTDSGCFGDTTIAVHVRSLPQAYFNPSNGCNGQVITFHDETTEGEGSLFSWSWDFGDTQTSNGQNPAHAFADTGLYVVELISTDSYGCTDTAEREVIIRLTPNVDFSFTENCFGFPTAFTETTVMPPWAGIVSRTWKFGDGSTSSAKNTTHTYALAGGYAVTLINRSINGCVDSVAKVLQVYPYPVAGFESDVACEGSAVCFHDTSYVLGGIIAEWDWNFGNGQGDTVAAPCTEFADTGFYVVQLKVASDFGCSSTVSDSLEVHPVPQSDFSLTPEYGIPPLDVQFFNYTQGAISYNWSFGDGGYSGATNPQHTYNLENVYNIILVSENEFGCTDTASANIYVIPSILDLVLTKLTVTDSAGYLNLKAQFFNNGTRNIRKVALDARVGNNIPIREEWSGLLSPGQYNNYNFTASFLKPDISNIRLVCLDISTLDSYGQEDTEPENNASCHSLVEDFFIASVFPSPAADYVYADISIPDDGDVEISLVSRDGRELIKEVIEDTEAGTLRLKMDLRFLADGLYILHATFEDKTDMYRFVKTSE